ncbi:MULTISPECIES: heme exporter protein CcmD [unclassified Sphingomonas]|nr:MULTISPECIES: heme exporter protein CcmD [unclassified Sphingomonas]MCR5872299.1 heme exporter protein CcmD [Sphingomonas sp. J344]UUX99402.1 heme exporter protein CcmD [Sphingomonas sp. J315]
MNHWPFIIAAYAVVTLGIGGLSLASWVGMRRAEAASEALRDRR